VARHSTGSGNRKPARGTPDWRYPPLPSALADLRGRVRDALAGCGVVGLAAEDVVLVVSELASNAMEHARTPLTVALGCDGDRVQVWVRDHSPEPPVLRTTEDDGRRGWGLRMITELATWGWEQHPEGKTVWATIQHGTRGLQAVRP